MLLFNCPKVNAQQSEAISPRLGSRMVVDTENNRIVLFGGYNLVADREYFDDTWIFSPTDNSWTSLLVDGPSPRGAHAMAYSPEQGIILLFGGMFDTTRLDDTWVFDCATDIWTQIETDIAPEGRSDSDIVFDPVRGVFILYGGWGDNNGFQSDTWELNPETKTWSMYDTGDTPGPMYGQRLEYDTMNERVMLYGGHLRSPISREYIKDLWYYYPDNSSWVKSATMDKLHGRYWTAAAFSPQFSSLVIFGGIYGEGAINETWILNTNTMSWTQLVTSDSPSRRVISDMVYVETQSCFILFGGGGLIGDHYEQYNDTWKLDPVTWTWSRIQTSYTTSERTQLTEQSIIGYQISTIITGIGLLILFKRLEFFNDSG